MIDEDEEVVLVDDQDRELGRMKKLDAHRTGALHRAISIFVFDAADRLILQRRAREKYHSGGQWANTCCSHPRPDESAENAAHRRLLEEMGFDCPLAYRTSIVYRAPVGSDLIEHELVRAYIGHHRGPILPDPAEVSEWRALSLAQLAQDIQAQPSAFTPWLRIYVQRHEEALFGSRNPD